MTLTRGLAGVIALGWLAFDAAPAEAAWDNVFQVCCHSCRGSTSRYYAAPPTVAYYAPAPVVAYASPCNSCNPCPCPSVSYVQRCYYQPVTTYQQVSYYEPVTSYRTSYYYEPVTSYRYTTYYDPCTGCPQQVATPCTSYRLRSQCNPVTSYVQRCALKPVTSYKQVSYYEAVTTCAPPAAAPPVAAAPAPAYPPPPVATEPPIATEQRTPPPGATEERIAPLNSYKTGPTSPAAPPRVTPRPERIASATDAATVQGQVVRDDRSTPRTGIQLVFVRSDDQQTARTVSVDPAGRFAVSLASGDWHLYEKTGDGQSVWHSDLTIRANQNRNVQVVSR
jgi:hypothetical protein